MQNVLIVLAILAVCAIGVVSYRKKLKNGCCGGGDTNAERKVRVADRNKAHYPYAVRLTIDGMTCGNCAQRVENALNRLDGVWATVDLSERSALVRSKTELSDDLLRKTVLDTGYTMLKCEKVSG